MAGVKPEAVADFLAAEKTGLPTGYRVLYEDGNIPPDEMRNVRHRGMDIAKKLRSEGVEFDEDGRAAQEQRLTKEVLRERSEALDEPPAEPSATRAWLVRPRQGGGELEHQGTVVDITNTQDALTGLGGTAPAVAGEPEAVEQRRQASTPPELPTATAEFAAELHLDREWLQELTDVLGDKQQLVLYGPPGTGKT
jgi:hypothetical protein